MIVNLIDNNISHAISYDDALEKGRVSKKISYVRDQDNFDGITVFTDNKLSQVKSINSKYKVAWLMEPRAYSPDAYERIEMLAENFNLILTYDEKILNSFREKSIHIPADGIFLDSESIFGSQEKNKMCSHIYSEKTILSGHKLRHTIASLIKEKNYNVDLFGSGSGRKLIKKSDALKSYRFSISIEKNNDTFYVTEKIYDCFAMRTVPIYHGTNHVLDKFNPNGIIMFDSIEELEKILQRFTPELYESMIDAVEENYKLVMKHYSVDDHIAEALEKFFKL